MVTEKLMHKPVRLFRKVAFAEGVSFLLLVFIAMPLKYFAGMPEAVKILGWAHGILFVAFQFLALETKSILGRNFAWLVKAFMASILPFGTFIFDRWMVKDLAEN